MFQLTSLSVLWDVVFTFFFSSIVVLTLYSTFRVVPLYSEIEETADNAYSKPEATVYSQHCIVPKESITTHPDIQSVRMS
jgi:hypothetical protein